jgi:hypothetical protein
MAQLNELVAGPMAGNRPVTHGGGWQVSWPLVTGMFSYVFLYQFYYAGALLRDGDVYWHIAAGRWMFEHGVVPGVDPFSHTMRGEIWTAHEWLSEVILAAAHQWGGWTLVVAVTAVAFAATIALLTRALLRTLEPVYAVLFAVMASAMTIGHVLARPHILAMPIMMVWVVELVRASDERRAPPWWLVPLMMVWANLHGGFTLGIALALAFTAESALASWGTRHFRATLRAWGAFTAFAILFSLLTPNGAGGILFTWQVMVESTYAMSRIEEWVSPNFHTLQPLEIWLLGGLAVVMYQGLRLPLVRLVLVLGLLHLSLKHVRNIELTGLLVPLFVAAPFAAQWSRRDQASGRQAESLDRLFRSLSQPAGYLALLGCVLLAIAIPLGSSRLRPIKLPESAVPAIALGAAEHAGLKGPVLNSYEWGGYLAYSGIAPFIDGRSDMYGDKFLQDYMEALQLAKPDSLEKLLVRYDVTWTLLRPGTPAIALLDRLPGWRVVHSDPTAVVHARIAEARR